MNFEGAELQTVADAIGKIVWLMSQSDDHKHASITSLEAEVFPSVLQQTFRIFEKDGTPVACVMWEMEGKQAANIRVIAPFGDATAIRTHFLETYQDELTTSAAAKTKKRVIQ